jgi:integrase
VRTFFDWAKDDGHVTENPFDRVKVKGGTKEKKRQEYTHSEVQLLLDNADPATDPKHWLFLIGLYIGARIREVAQLRVEDIQVVQSVHVFDITEDAEDKLMSVKNKPSHRKTPIHDELLRRGLLTYVEELQVNDEARLFPMFSGNAMDGYADSSGQWFRKTFRKKIGLKRGFHELRNTAITALNEAGVLESHVNAIVGHGLGRSTSLGTYAGALSMPTLKAAIDKLPINPGRK